MLTLQNLIKLGALVALPLAASQPCLRTTGSCVTDYTSNADCSAAGVLLNLCDTTSSADGQNNVNFDPAGCYYENGDLKYNVAASNSGPCTATDVCVCNEAPGVGCVTFDPATGPGDTCAAVSGDPHFSTGHGDRFDFKGKDKTLYNVLSHTAISVNALFAHADYHLGGPKHRLIHGSFIRGLYAAITTAHGHRFHVTYESNNAAAAVIEEVGGRTQTMRVGDPTTMQLDDVNFSLDKRTLTLTHPQWEVKATSKVVNGIVNATDCANGRCILNVQVKPTFDVNHAKVAPHGLIGQSYDGDAISVLGKTDVYTQASTTTSAMGEGAIEGAAEQYEMAGKFDTAFAFSRFNLTAAAPRDVTKLAGEKRKMSGATDAAAPSGAK